MPSIIIVLVAIVVLALVLLSSTIKIVQEYERGVIFRLGRLVGARGPGLFFLIPGAERMRKVDLRIVTLEVPAQEAITRDNVTVKVNAVVYFRVVDPEEAVVKVLDYVRATSLIGQTTLRSILGQSDLDHLLSQRDKINAELQQVIDTQTSAWGVKVTSVEVRDLELPQSMQRAMAREAEAEREKRAERDSRGRQIQCKPTTRQRCPGHRKPAGNAPAAELANAHRDRRREELDHRVPTAVGAAARVFQSGAPKGTRQRSHRQPTSGANAVIMTNGPIHDILSHSGQAEENSNGSS